MALLFNLSFVVYLVMFVQVPSIINQFGADQTYMFSGLLEGATSAGMRWEAVFEKVIAFDTVSLQVMDPHVTRHSFPVGSTEWTSPTVHTRDVSISYCIVMISGGGRGDHFLLQSGLFPVFFSLLKRSTC